VRLGPRPAGSPASRRLARRLRAALPHGRFQAVPGGLRNVIGNVRGRDPHRLVVVGAHYDTKDIPGFVGANDGASGTAAVVELARELRPRQLRPTVVFALFDGEESPAGTSDEDFEREGLRGSKVAARVYHQAEAMVLLDFVGDRDLEIPRERNSSGRLWARLRRAARRVGTRGAFPRLAQGRVLDDHIPFLMRGVPAIDLIDFDFPCFHRTCDDLSAVSERSLDAVGETVFELLRTL
jgi:Zn-dependent M28 family amino/carboxypeptidase